MEGLVLPKQHVLEIGVGSGFTANYLRSRGVQVTTLDIDHEKEPDSFLKFHEKVDKPITTDYVNMFEALTPEERALQVSVMGDTLKHLGYDLDDEPRDVGLWERERYVEEERVGALLSHGAVEYRKWSTDRRVGRKERGIWNAKDRAEYQTRDT